MDCEKASYRVYRYLDGELTVYRRWSIRRHLHKCPPCAQGFDFEAEVLQIVARKCAEQAPPGLTEKILAALRGEGGTQVTF